MEKLVNNIVSACSPPEELAALLYGEMDAASRASIETHLAACDSCTTEFADLSFARLDVYEWHRDEFVEMPTPRIVIPYAEVVTGISWLDGFRGLFAGYGQWATAGAAFAGVAVVFVGVWLYGSKPVDVARTDKGSAVIPVNERPAAAPTPGTAESKPQIIQRDAQPQKASAEPVKKQPVQPAKGTASPSGRVRPANQPVQAKQPAPPRLNDFEDEDDTTLRLGDLLAEVDTRNKL